MGMVIDKGALFSKIGYQPFVEQRNYHNSPARFRVPVCGRRFGKSTMAGRDLEPKLLVPKGMYWITGPTYDLGEKEFRVIWDDLIVKLGMGRDKRVKKAYNKKQGNMFIQFPWSTRLEVRSADHPENLVGEALDGVIMSEAAKHQKDTWERYIRPALADKRGFGDFPTTPEGFNWLHQLWQLGNNPNFPDYESWRFPSWANTMVYPGGREDREILLLEQTTMPEYFMQEIGADFASFVGKIFPEWDENVHVTSVPFIPGLPSYMTFDWGYTNPLAAIEFQITPRDEIRIWRMHYKSFTVLEDHIQILKNREQPEGYHLDLAFGDAADPEAAATVSRHLVACIADPKAKADYTWREGIDLIRTFMKTVPGLYGTEEIDEFGTPAPDRPRLLVDHSCMNMIREFNNYKSKEPVKGQNVPEWGQKMDDHAIDALRYALIHIFKLGATSHLSDVIPAGGGLDQWKRDSVSGLTLDSFEGSGFGSINGLSF